MILPFSDFDCTVCTMHDFLQDPINLRNRITWCYSITKLCSASCADARLHSIRFLKVIFLFLAVELLNPPLIVMMILTNKMNLKC